MILLTRKCVNPVLAKISIKTGPDHIKNGRIPGTWGHGDTGTRGHGAREKEGKHISVYKKQKYELPKDFKIGS